MPRSEADLKRKLRQLKKLERKIRFHSIPAANQTLVWDTFFSTKTKREEAVRYSLQRLTQMDRNTLKEVFEEYFYRVFFQSYQEQGLLLGDLYDPQLLALIGLPPLASQQEIKQRFRSLAKKYHPDTGGDSEKFVELMDVYDQLSGTQ